MKLVVLTTHPIQYQVPWFRLLHADPEVELMVWFCMIPDAQQQGEGFGVSFEWDIPLLDGYNYEVLGNVAAQPSVTRFSGCDTPEVYARLRRERPDAVLVNGWVVKSCLQALWACKRLGIPCLVRGEANRRRERAWWKEKLQGVLVRQYSGALAIGSANRAFYEFHGIPPSNIVDTPYCVDNEAFAKRANAARQRSADLRERWALPEELPILLFVGKFEAKKHPMFLLDLLSQLRGRAHLLMVGSGPLEADCREITRIQDLPVSFAGFLNQSEIADAYAVSDALMLPSDDGETWGLVANEAMACGLFVCVSDRPGCAGDLVVDGETGLVLPFGKRDRWVEELDSLLQDNDRMTDLKRAAMQQVSSYHFERVAQGVKELLDTVRGGNGNS